MNSSSSYILLLIGVKLLSIVEFDTKSILVVSYYYEREVVVVALNNNV